LISLPKKEQTGKKTMVVMMKRKMRKAKRLKNFGP
jgi:hypothetical protein